MYTFCIVLIIIASILMILAVLVQSPKSGMAANFGASNQVMGVRQTADVLEKATWGLAVTILILTLIAVAVGPKQTTDKNKDSLRSQQEQVDKQAGVGIPSQDAADAANTTPAAPTAASPAGK